MYSGKIAVPPGGGGIVHNNHPLPKTETKKYKQGSINKLPLVSLFQVRTLLCNKIKHESYD
jgi:hypothetical protein